MNKAEKYSLIVKEAKKTAHKLEELYEQKGTYEAPVEVDLVKTVKAMFFENVMTILKKKENENG